MNRKEHWETIYESKKLTEVSWYQPIPTTAIEYLLNLQIGKEDAIIDVGGGDSFFVDYLVENNYQHVSVLDISEKAIKRAQNRLGEDASKVNWIVDDALSFKGETVYDFWYDRAAFHFLTNERDITSYIDSLEHNLSKKGKIVIGTFSEKGPTKCSGIDIKQYSMETLEHQFASSFVCLSCKQLDHITPFGTVQHFTFCNFKRK